MEINREDGMNYSPVSLAEISERLKEGELNFAVIGLDHGHIHAMTQGLTEIGATPVAVYDEDFSRTKAFAEKHHIPACVTSVETIMEDPCVNLILSAIRPDKRTDLGLQAMLHGKDYFVDKPGALTLNEVKKIRETCAETGRKNIVYFGERVHVEGAVYAQKLIEDGKIGRVLSITILAPHRLNKESRPEWFFDKNQNGAIIQDIGSHQMEQFLTYSGAEDAKIVHSAVANYANKDKKNFYDFGEFSIVTDNGTAGYCRLDWFTPDGMRVWGDGRVFIVGEKGSIEIRKYIDAGNEKFDDGDIVIFTDAQRENRIECRGSVGFPFFYRVAQDMINRTENEITQSHILKSMELTIEAQMKAVVIE
ncbi:MAG: Gfo/Idh/MocA family oxidoreductase [Sphaerochaetaceae bacterium]|nr:Gfo/Idh/MocA family oxidoreductase [Sphaerochaetaceae bacterium]